MTSVALIGGDGAGKSTVAKAILQTTDLPIKYLYMGMSTRSSDHALPTSRFVFWLKKQRISHQRTQMVSDPTGEISANDLEYSQNSHGWLWNTARFLNRLAEAGYRQMLSSIYQLRGRIVLYDRHFFFDAVPEDTEPPNKSAAFFDSLFYQIINALYPRPTVAIFLDAPAEVLFSRKGEASPDYLARQREQYLKQGLRMDHFIRVDATQPLDSVINEVKQIIEVIHSGRINSVKPQPQNIRD